jgi:hypothetical protein
LLSFASAGARPFMMPMTSPLPSALTRLFAAAAGLGAPAATSLEFFSAYTVTTAPAASATTAITAVIARPVRFFFGGPPAYPIGGWPPGGNCCWPYGSWPHACCCWGKPCGLLCG